MTFVDRETRCILSWSVCWEANASEAGQILSTTPRGCWYYSDANLIYQGLGYYSGIHYAMSDKSETYSVEGTTPSCGITSPG